MDGTPSTGLNMIPEPRLSNKALAELCHRLAVETEAGIDIRRTWQREADSARGRIRPYFDRVREGVVRGDSLSESLALTGRVFPPLFQELAHVGEETGTLGRVMQRMERHYRRLVQAQRTFIAAITWPMIELGLAVLIIGLLIWVMGWIGRRTGAAPMDMLGFGLVGTSGLVIYTNIILAIALAIYGLVFAVRRGALWTRPLQRVLIRLPGVGPCLAKLALAQMAWALHLSMNVAMDVRRVVPLVLRATGNDYYIRHTEQVVSAVQAGEPLAQALARTRAFPADFLDSLAVGEESGQVVESMGRLADRYEEEAESAIKTLATLAGVAVFVIVAALITWLIFRLFSGYVGAYSRVLNGIK
jgi:type II secretory pathway component PulF